MTDIDKLREEELKQLNADVTQEEVNLEDLLVFGDDTKIPITITFPHPDGVTTSKAKALIKQLTLKELDTSKIMKNNPEANLYLLETALFKANGDRYAREELEKLPLGVVNTLASKILEVSGIDIEQQLKLANF